MSSKTPWYDEAFRGEYLDLYAHRDDASARAEVRWLLETLELPAEAKILDLACGDGRHLRAFQSMGSIALGLDRSRDLLRRAREKGTESQLLRGDLRKLPFTRSFDLITLFFTSFGYFPEEAEDLAVLNSISAALRDGGQVMIDFLNAAVVRESLVPESEKRIAGMKLSERRRISEDGRRVQKTVTIIGPGEERRSYREDVRLYELDDFEGMFAKVGLRSVASFGSLSGERFDASRSPRLVILACKEKHDD